MQRNSQALAWRGKGVSDSLDGSSSFNGSMQQLQNLITDPSTSMVWQCRPAAIQLISLNGGPFSSGFSPGFQSGGYFAPGTAGFISCFIIVGDIVFGLAADTAIPGHDAPFAFNLSNLSFVVVTGTINATTTPASPPTTGVWVPPQMAVIGSKIIVTHAGFTGVGGNYIGWFDISTPSAPVWHAGNMTGLVSFAIAPTGVAQFYNRAYYIYNLPAQPAVIFSDPLNPTNATNANQILTFADNIPLTAIAGLPLFNQLGGVVQSLIVFKGVSNMYQITGDAALTLNPLSVNSLNIATGTLAPLSVCSTPKGLAFLAPDGLRIIDFTAKVSDPIGNDGQGITVPLIFAAVPSRVVAACNGELLRISTQNSSQVGSPNQAYWHDLSRKIWTGPHTFPSSLIQPYKQTFIMTPVGINASLWQSDFFQSSTSSFTENGTVLSWIWQTTLLPDTDKITNNAMTEATMDLAAPSGISQIAVSAVNQNGASINSVSITSTVPGSNTKWGQFQWGNAPWAGGVIGLALQPYELQWTKPIVFSRMSIKANGSSALALKIGALHLRYQMLKIWTNTQAAA